MVACLTNRCAGALPLTSSKSDVGVVDVFAVGLSAFLAPHVLPAVRALQRRHLARAYPGARARCRDPRFGVASSSGAGPYRRGDPGRMLDLGRVGVSLEPL